MPSSYTDRNRLTLQATGENINTWGVVNNVGVVEQIDFALDGVTTISAGGSVVLTTANGADDQSRARMLKITAPTAAAITIASVEKWYLVCNLSSTVSHTITNGAASVTIYPGERTAVLTDGAAVWKFVVADAGGQRIRNVGAPGDSSDAATKGYVESIAFENVGDLPAQAGNAGKFVSTDGTNASWQPVEVENVGGLADVLQGIQDEISDVATPEEFRAGGNGKNLPSDAPWTAAEGVTIPYALSLTLDFDAFVNAQITLTGNATIGAPSNAKPGQAGLIRAVQDATGNRTITWNSAFKFALGRKTLSTTPGAVDYVSYVVWDANTIICALVVAPS